jgi:hypothetical protein
LPIVLILLAILIPFVLAIVLLEIVSARTGRIIAPVWLGTLVGAGTVLALYIYLMNTNLSGEDVLLAPLLLVMLGGPAIFGGFLGGYMYRARGAPLITRVQTKEESDAT